MKSLIKHLSTLLLLSLSGLILVSCTTGTGASQNKQTHSLYPIVSTKQCNDAGGEVIGDIGDGRIHSADYLCDNGTAPIGTIRDQDEPVMTEGAICCGP